jgi:hypothetical protein
LLGAFRVRRGRRYLVRRAGVLDCVAIPLSALERSTHARSRDHRSDPARPATVLYRETRRRRIDEQDAGDARLKPGASAGVRRRAVIRDGLVLKGTGNQIYTLQDDQLRWISSLEAFEHLGLTWDDLHQVDDPFLAQFEAGRPIDILLKCDGSPHIYALQDGARRWIKDLATFAAEGYVWDDVRIVDCTYLRGLPDGAPIPPDAGTPPRP